MVNIITGRINSGKTTKIKALYNQLNRGDGIISKKYMKGNDVYGFNIYLLEEASETPFMIHEKQITNEMDKAKFIYNIGPYWVYRKAIELINNYYDDLIQRKVQPLFFDEVGVLELNEKGFYNSINKAITSDLDIYLVTRDDLIEKIIKKFEITEYKIIGR